MIPALELRRKALHVAFSGALGLLLLLGVADYASLLVITAACLGITGAYWATRRHERPLFSSLFRAVERPENASFPGRNMVSILAAALLGYWLFSPGLIGAGLVVLAVADPVAYLYGVALGRVRVPWNPEKHVEGRVLGALVAALFLSPRVAFLSAFGASLLAMLVETLPLERVYLDDNFVVPLVVAAILAF